MSARRADYQPQQHTDCGGFRVSDVEDDGMGEQLSHQGKCGGRGAGAVFTSFLCISALLWAVTELVIVSSPH